MADIPSEPSPRDPYAALRYPEFRNFAAAIFLLTAALLAQETLLGYELYRLTRDPLTLGLVGLAEAIPFISLALFGGHVADRRDKRGILLAALSLILACSLWLAGWLSAPVQARLGRGALLGGVYAVIAIIGFARGFFSPTASSLKAFLVPRALYANSSAWSSSSWQAGAILGPALGGFLYAALGFTGSLLAIAAVLGVALQRLTMIAPRPAVQVSTAPMWQSVMEGIGFVRRSPVILYALTLDLFSVLFGGVVAILPVFAQDILDAGPQGLGILRAAPSLGAVLTMLWLAHHPPLERGWRNMLLAVAGFGVATLVFAVSKSFWLSAAMLFATGAFDSVSVIIRGTLLQMIPPDHMRGRVASVNSVFVTSSNELGAFESGLAARVLGTVPSVLFGGAMTLVVVGWIARRTRGLLNARLDAPDAASAS